MAQQRDRRALCATWDCVTPCYDRVTHEGDIALNITRLSICSLVVISAALGLGSYAIGSSASDDANEILRISSLRMSALGANDFAIWARYTSDRYQIINDEGAVLTKSAVIAGKKAEHYPDSSVWLESPSVRFMGETALVTGKALETEKYPGGTMFTNYRLTILYAKERGEWMAQASQVTVLLKNYAKGIKMAPTALAPFTGRYEWAPEMIETLSINGSRLMSTFEGSTEPLIFLGPNATTLTDDLAIGTFYRDATGKVAGYVYRRCDGQAIRIPKLQSSN
jgi:hypothetical protein